MVDPPFLIAFCKIFLEFITIFLHWFFFKYLADNEGLIFDKYKISLAYIFPIPDTKFWSIDQNFVSGIGNIYASEILYLSKINPSLSAKYLKKNQCKNIVINSRKILQNAIRKGGSTIRDFKNTKGDQGNFQKEFKVYGRDKQKCKRFSCLGTINKITQSNRSTFFCEICQK